MQGALADQPCPILVPHEREAAVVEGLEPRPVADRDQGRVRQKLAEIERLRAELRGMVAEKKSEAAAS